MTNVVKYIFVLGRKKNAMSFWKWYHQNIFLIDKLFVIFGGRLCFKTCSGHSHPLSGLLFQSYAAYSMWGLLVKNENKIAKSCSITFFYIDDVCSLNKSQFGDYLDCIYHYEKNIDTINIASSALFWSLLRNLQ